MRLDHIAYRVKNRVKTAKFFMDAFGYTMQNLPTSTEDCTFELHFSDGSTAKCIALEPPEKKYPNAPWIMDHHFNIHNHLMEPGLYGYLRNYSLENHNVEYHLPPEIFVSDGSPDSIVGQWVANRGGIGGIHHLAYQVPSVEDIVKLWKEKGYAEFSSEDVLKCPGLTQIFTKPSELTGVIVEFINRGTHGFCAENVQSLMESTKDFK